MSCSSLRRSGMARVDEGSHTFTCHHTFIRKWNKPYRPLQFSFTFWGNKSNKNQENSKQSENKTNTSTDSSWTTGCQWHSSENIQQRRLASAIVSKQHSYLSFIDVQWQIWCNTRWQNYCSIFNADQVHWTVTDIYRLLWLESWIAWYNE